MVFGNKLFNSPFLTQWVGDDLQNVSPFYGGPSNELNWTYLNDRQRSSLWQSDDGATKTLDAWEDGYVVTTNPSGTLTAKPKYTSGLPELTLRRVDTMSADEEGSDTSTPELGPGGEEQPEETKLDPAKENIVVKENINVEESKPLFGWNRPAGYILAGIGGVLLLGVIANYTFMMRHPEAYVASTAISSGASLLKGL
jgi:hypothetical protein